MSSPWRRRPHGRPIGMVDYRGVDPYEGVAEVGIFIGEQDFWSHGYGTEALGLLVDHLFGMFPLHRLELDTWSGNTRAARAFARLGFQEEGRRRDAVLLMRRPLRPPAVRPAPPGVGRPPPLRTRGSGGHRRDSHRRDSHRRAVVRRAGYTRPTPLRTDVVHWAEPSRRHRTGTLDGPYLAAARRAHKQHTGRGAVPAQRVHRRGPVGPAGRAGPVGRARRGAPGAERAVGERVMVKRPVPVVPER